LLSKLPKIFSLGAADYLILFFSLTLRLVHLWMIRDNPFFDAPILDADIFDQKAWKLAQGESFADGAYFQPPLYTYFLAALYSIFNHSYMIPRLIQALLGALTAWIVFRLAGRIYNRKIAITAGIIIALYGPLIHYNGQLLITTLFIFLVSLFLLLFDRLIEKPAVLNFFIAGAVFGLAAITRPNILIFLPLAAVWIFFKFSNRIKKVVFFLLGAAIIILPVTVRNYVVEKDFVLISSQGGVNFYMGNNPIASGRSAWVPGTAKDWWGEGYRQSITIAERAAGRELKSSEISGYYWRRAVEEMSVRPAVWLDLMQRKIRFLLAGYEISDNEDIYYQRKYSCLSALLLWNKVIAFPYGIVFPLAIFGLIFTFSWKRQSHLLLFQISFALGLLLFFITARFRLPLIPIFSIWAAAGLMQIFLLIKYRTIARYTAAFIGLILLVIVVNRNPVAGEVKPRLDGSLNLGSRYLEDDQFTEALEAYREAESIDSMSSRAKNGAAVALLNLGQIAEAKSKFERAILLEPSLKQAHNNLARILQQEGNLNEAQRHFTLVLRIDSTDIFAHRGYADIASEQLDWIAAEEHYEDAYYLGAVDRQIFSRWANAVLQQGKYAEALVINAKLLGLEPDNARAHHNQARIYIYCDSLQQAEEELYEVLRLAPNTAEARQQLNDVQKILSSSGGGD